MVDAIHNRICYMRKGFDDDNDDAMVGWSLQISLEGKDI